MCSGGGGGATSLELLIELSLLCLNVDYWPETISLEIGLKLSHIIGKTV